MAHVDGCPSWEFYVHAVGGPPGSREKIVKKGT